MTFLHDSGLLDDEMDMPTATARLNAVADVVRTLDRFQWFTWDGASKLLPSFVAMLERECTAAVPPDSEDQMYELSQSLE